MQTVTRIVGFASLLTLAGANPSTDAQSPSGACDPRWLSPSAIEPSRLALPRPPVRPSRCTSVAVGPVELGSQVVVPGAARCELAVLYRRITTPTETCGYDVHYEPIVETGLVVLRPARGGLRQVAHLALDGAFPGLDALTVRPRDSDGLPELRLGERVRVEREGRTIRLVDLPR